MKKVILFLLLSTLLIGCVPAQQSKVESNIKKFVSENGISDYYESVSLKLLNSATIDNKLRSVYLNECKIKNKFGDIVLKTFLIGIEDGNIIRILENGNLIISKQ